MKWVRLGVLVLAAPLGAGVCASGAGCGSDGTVLPVADAGVDSTGMGDTGGGPVDASGDVTDSAPAPDAPAGVTTLTLPQLVHGAARVDKEAFHTIPLLITTSGAPPASVRLTIDQTAPLGGTPIDATHFVATISAAGLADGAHTLTATALSARGRPMGSVNGSLVVGSDSLQFTQFAKAGPAYASHLVLDAPGDRLGYTWVDVANGTRHQLNLNYLDGAGARLMPADVVLNDPADEPLGGYTAFAPSSGASGGDIGVVYRVQKAGDPYWLVKMRVVDAMGSQKVPTMDLTQGEAALSMAAAGVDPGGFSAAWLHIRPLDDAGNDQPVELRFSRWDTAKGKLVGPLVLDSDQPQPTGSTQGPQQLKQMAEMSIACNKAVCLVLYSRDAYEATVDLNVPKLWIAKVDLATGQLAGAPQPVEISDWDTQEFGQQLVALADGTFVLAYTATDTATAVNPITPCDSTLGRDLLFTVRLDATGALMGAPKPVFDFQGSREYPRIAPHPDGWALFWEDQRSECDATGGHIGMAMNVASPDLSMLLDPYLEATGSIALPPMDPSIAVTGTNFVAAWSDNRHDNGLTMPASEVYFETYWRR